MGVAGVNISLLEPQAKFLERPAPFNLLQAGQGSGKSHGLGLVSALMVASAPKCIGLIAANTYDQLSRATINACRRVWEHDFRWTEYNAKSNPDGNYVIGKHPPDHFIVHHRFMSNNNNIYFSNGAVIFLASLDRYENIEGIEVAWACLDETADTDEMAVKKVISARLRQRGLCVFRSDVSTLFPYCSTENVYADKAKEINPLFVFTKPAKTEWLSNMFRLDEHRSEILKKIYDPAQYFHTNDGVRQTVIYSLYHNSFLSESYIKNRFELLAGSGLEGQLIYGDPFSSTGNEYVTAFDKSKHIHACQIDESEPLHFTLDFNTRPYMSGLLIQLHERTGAWEGRESWYELCVVDEYALEMPKNTAGDLAEELCNDYSEVADMGMYVYGDASGKNAVPIKGVKSAFDDFTTHMTMPYDLRVPSQNPRYKAALGKGSLGRRAFTNKLFSGKLGVKITINPKCKQFIADLDYCKQGPNGDLMKERNGEGIEMRSHHLQAFEYAVCHPKFLGWLAKLPVDDYSKDED